MNRRKDRGVKMIIAKDIDLSAIVDDIVGDFKRYEIFAPIVDDIKDRIRILSRANYLCYIANMSILKIREAGSYDKEGISRWEMQARVVGEQRVRSKRDINKLIASMAANSSGRCDMPGTIDDVVYSVGDMIDRLTIEYIKRAEFAITGRDDDISVSMDWSERVHRYLIVKLEAIQTTGYYECVEELRTYDSSSVLQDTLDGTKLKMPTKGTEE